MFYISKKEKGEGKERKASPKSVNSCALISQTITTNNLLIMGLFITVLAVMAMHGREDHAFLLAHQNYGLGWGPVN